ncbi:hypothetical protein FQR65_LT08211 [Abscondita terminalis]|nr:hypothetical protein FQR65_LT08211 [Abscondita terminalis]
MKSQNIFDSILVEVGEFGIYQKIICTYILFVATIAYFPSVIYVFEAKQIHHRCNIFGCDLNGTEFKPSWWINAIPAEDGEPTKCSKFRRINGSSDTCYASDFDRQITEPCASFVYETSEMSILHDFNLQCDDNVWKLTLVGTLHSAGLFVGLPISGLLSDRFGRKTILIITALLSGIIGIVRSFSTSYPMYVTLEVLDASVRAGLYAICYILGLELVGPEKRGLISLLISAVYPIGGVFVGGMAWIVQSWRTLLKILYPFNFVVILYYWLIPESVRWLLARNEFSKAQNILLKVANVNGRTISEENLKELESYNSNKEIIETNSITELFKSVTLMLRIINCSVCWICCIFVYNGLTINSVDISENSYLDFILSLLVEIPGNVAAYVLVDRIGRKLSLTIGFLISAISCIASIFIPDDLYWLVLITYLLGKGGISINILVIYTITSEIFPTSYRNALLASCSMFGRIGSMVAPQMPILESTWKPLPMILFGSAGIIAAFLSLLLPETMNTKLPNTIKEAEDIGTIRCKIVGCDVESTEYLPIWWQNAIPEDDGKPSKCLKFKRLNESNTESCEASSFNHQEKESCKDFIYETTELSILQTFGRKTILIYGLTLSGLIGLARSFANSYALFTTLVCLDAMCRSGSYPTVWILGSELVEPKKRVLISFLISVVYALGGMLQGLLAWIFQSWRVLLRITYAFNFIMVFYYWLIPESITWLLAEKRFTDVKRILKHLSEVNGRDIPETVFEDLEKIEVDKKEIHSNTTSELLKSKVLMMRLVNCSVCWICCIFLYNGLTINSVELSNNSYLDYILTMTVEIPGCIAYIVTDYVGRRIPLAGGCLVSGLASICLIFIPTDLYWSTICTYMMAKFGISISISVIYTITTEVFPTPFRNSLLTMCTMFGGLGAIAAPQLPLLARNLMVTLTNAVVWLGWHSCGNSFVVVSRNNEHHTP